MKQLVCLIASGMIMSASYLYSDIYGSDFDVSALPAFTAPTNPAIANRIANFGWAQNGFTLRNAFTSLIFDSVFPVSGPIQMNGGTLILSRDLILSNTTSLQSLGTIIGDGHVLSLNEDASSLPADTTSFKNTRLFLNSDIVLQSPVTFNGSCNSFSVVEGNGHMLTLAGAGAIINNGNLALRNITLQGVSGTNVQNDTNASVLTLDNVTWIQTGSSTFNTGSLLFENEVTFRGAGTAFSYLSNQQSVIASNATLILGPRLTFNYAPTSHASQTLLGFQDASSELILNGATLQSSGIGFQFLRGNLLTIGNSFLAAEPGRTITIGDGNAVHDTAVTIRGESCLKFAQGILVYKNALNGSWIMESSTSILHMSVDTTLQLQKTLNLGIGLAVLDDPTMLQRLVTAFLLGSIQTLGTTIFEII